MGLSRSAAMLFLCLLSVSLVYAMFQEAGLFTSNLFEYDCRESPPLDLSPPRENVNERPAANDLDRDREEVVTALTPRK